MLDTLNNRILEYLENHCFTAATVYWRVIGKYIPVWM